MLADCCSEYTINRENDVIDTTVDVPVQYGTTNYIYTRNALEELQRRYLSVANNFHSGALLQSTKYVARTAPVFNIGRKCRLDHVPRPYAPV
jgi:hypothetical protein